MKICLLILLKKLHIYYYFFLDNIGPINVLLVTFIAYVYISLLNILKFSLYPKKNYLIYFDYFKFNFPNLNILLIIFIDIQSIQNMHKLHMILNLIFNW